MKVKEKPIVKDEDFEVTSWVDRRHITYIRIPFPNNSLFAKVRQSYDGERFVIHVGRKYIGYCRTEENAIHRAKRALAEAEKVEYQEEQ